MLISFAKHAQTWFWWFCTNVVSQLTDRLKIRTNRITSELAEVTRNRWISAARIIEYPQANLFDRSICSLVWATLASFWKLSRSVCIRQTINFDEINVSNRHAYYPVNTCIRIALISSLIDGFSRTNCRPWVHPKGVEDTPLIRLCNGSATALQRLYHSSTIAHI